MKLLAIVALGLASCTGLAQDSTGQDPSNPAGSPIDGDPNGVVAGDSDADPCADNSPPVANAGPDRAGNVGTVLTFDGRNSYDVRGSVAAYWWNFGDGQLTGWSTAQTVQHAYDQPGTYTVMLWVADNCGAMSALDTSVVAVGATDPCAGKAAPTASAGVDQSALAGDTVTLSGLGTPAPGNTITSFFWDLGDGQTSNTQNPAVSYGSAGVYTATLTVTDNCNRTGSDSVVITVTEPDPCAGKPAPTANAGADVSGNAGTPVSFSGSGGPAAGNTIAAYSWSTSDGQGSSAQSPTFTFSNVGTYTVTLTVTDNCGRTGSDSAIATIAAADPCAGKAAPTANAGADRDGKTGTGLSFVGNATVAPGNTVTSYRWNTSDGKSASTQSAFFTWTAVGTYTVTLTATDNCGRTGTDSAIVTITAVDPCAGKAAPTADAGPDKTGSISNAVSFAGSGTAAPGVTILWYSWTTSDGKSSSSQNPSFTWTNPGTYTVRLIVTDSCDRTDDDTAVVTITDPCANKPGPTANAGPDKSGTVGTPITLNGSGTAASGNIISAYSWVTSDGKTFSGKDAIFTWASVGTYSATLTVRDNCNRIGTDSVTITVNPVDPCAGKAAPTANAGVDKSANINTAVSFTGSGTAASGNTITSYAWSTSDGKTWNGQNASFTWAAAGTYTVTLTVTDNCSRTGTDTAIATIIDPCAGKAAPTANAGVDKSGQTNAAVSFTGSGTPASGNTITSYAWSTSDGKTSSSQNPSFTWANAGTYTVTLTVTDNCGRTGSDSAVATISAPDPCAGKAAPTANAGADKSGPINTTVSFTGSGTPASGNTITGYAWSTSDGKTWSGQNASFTWASGGTYTVTLTVTDSCGRTGSDSAVATITDPCAGKAAPTANAGADKSSTINTAVSFTGSGTPASGNTITSYAWSTSDGKTSSSQNPSFTWTNAGTYTVTLTVTDNCGRTGSDSAVATITDPCAGKAAPTANAGADKSSTINTAVSFTGSGTPASGNTITSYAWSTSDGKTSSSQNPSFTWANAGTYTVTLTVTDNCGRTGSDSAVATITDPCAGKAAPTANAGADKTGSTGAAVSFIGSGTPASGNTIASYAWSTSDGKTWSGQNASFTWSSPGTYTVTLTVTDNCGRTGGDSAIATISGPDPCAGKAAPTANAGVDASAQTNAAVNFTGSGTPASGNTITSYAWSTSDGKTSSSQNPSFTWTNAGTYTVTLTVTDNCGRTGSDSAVATISAPDPCAGKAAPTANAGADKTGLINAAISFTGGGTPASGNTITGYAWSTSDNKTSSAQNASFTWTTAGAYTVTLTVTDNCGRTGSDTATVTVNASNPGPLNADFRVLQRTSPTDWAEVGLSPSDPIEFGTKVRFDASPSTGATYFEFELYAGGIRWGQQVDHVYGNEGAYDVRLTVYDAAGTSTHTVRKTVHVSKMLSFIGAISSPLGSASDAALDGNVLWLGYTSGSLRAVDVTSGTSSMPTLLSASASVGRSVAVSEGLLFLCSGVSGLATYTADVTGPDFLGNYNTNGADGQSALDVAALGHVAYLAAGNAGVKVLNMSNPSSPQVLASVKLPGNASAQLLELHAGHVFVSDAIGKVHAINVSAINPWNPAPATIGVAATIDFGSFVNPLAVSEDGLLVAVYGTGFDLYDVSNPGAPIWRSTFDSYTQIGRVPGGVVFEGQRLHTTFGQANPFSPELIKFDVADPTNPYIMERLSISGGGGLKNPVVVADVLYGVSSSGDLVAFGIR